MSNIIAAKLHSEDLTKSCGDFLLANLEPFYFIAFFIHCIMFCHFLNY